MIVKSGRRTFQVDRLFCRLAGQIDHQVSSLMRSLMGTPGAIRSRAEVRETFPVNQVYGP